MYNLTRMLIVFAVLLIGFTVLQLSMLAAPWSFMLLFVGALIVAVKRHRGPALTAHGTAAWASTFELRAAGMLDGDTGLIIGRCGENAKPAWIPALRALFNKRVPHKEAVTAVMAVALKHWKFKHKGPLVRLPKAVHTAIFAPVGVGKSTGFVIPHLLTCPDSLVCVDFKGELVGATAHHRAKAFGHRVVVIDPYRVTTDAPDTFNPLDFIDKDHPDALDDCRDLSESQIVRTGQEKDPHFADMAEIWTAAFIAGVVQYGKPEDRSLQTVRKLLSDPAKIEGLIKLLCESDAWDGMLARLGNQLTNSKDKELSSTLTTTNRFLKYLDTKAISESTSSSTFDPNQLRNGKMTVYLVLPPDHMRAQSAFLRMMISSMLRAVVRSGLGEKNKVHFILDEASSLGRMDCISDALDKYRGYGVRLQFYYQSLGQLKSCWPEGQDQTLLSNVTQVFVAVNDNETAKYVSERLGEETIIVRSGGTTSGSSRTWSGDGTKMQPSTGRNYGSSENWNQHARKLLKLEEVMALDQRTAITFTPGMRPIWTNAIRYYEEKISFVADAIAQTRALVFGIGFLVYASVVVGLVQFLKGEINERSNPPVLRTGQDWPGNYAPPGGQGGYPGGSTWPQFRQHP